MRTAVRFLAVLTLAALLAPSVRWTSLRAPLQACACPPQACHCPGHHHDSGKAPRCCMANGGHCGLESPDSFLASILSTLIYVPSEHPWWDPLATLGFGCAASGSHLLPSHARIPEQPPRPRL